MPVDTEKIKKAFTDFENDEYYDAEETLSKEIKKAKNDYLKKELELDDDVEKVKDDDSDDSDNDDEDE